MESIFADLKFALRSLLKRRVFFAVAIGTFALGVGANTAIYSVVYGVIVSPLGYDDEGRLVAVSSDNPAEALKFDGNYLPDFWFWREHTRAFDQMAFHGWRSWTLQEPDRVERIESVAVSANLFRLLGVNPVIGRNFEPADEVPGEADVVLVSYGLWQRVWGGQPSVVGKSIILSGVPVTIIGVMPPETNVSSRRAEMWRPVGYLEQYERSPYGREERDFRVIGHLADGASLVEAREEMRRMSAMLSDRFPVTNAGWVASVDSLKHHLSGNARLPLLVAFAAVGMVLLIACTNLANLLLIRTMGRQREIALRAAIGAGRRRLMQYQIAESFILTAAGGAAGLVLAYGLSHVLLLYEPGILPRKDNIAIGFPAIIFTLGIALIAGLVFGIIPTFRRGTSLGATLKDGGSAVGGSLRQNRLRMVLAGSQLATALALVVGAGVMARGVRELSRVDPGFRPEGLYSSHIILGREYRGDLEKRRVYFKQIVQDVRALPGVSAAALTTTPPIPGMGIQIDVPFRGSTGPLVSEAAAPRAAFRILGPGYFETIGTSMLQGRDFTDRDTADSSPVAIVNATLAKRAFPGEDAVGRIVTTFVFGETARYEIVGVSSDTRFAGLDEPVRPALFLVHPQLPFLGMGVVARTTLGPASYGRAMRRSALARDPSVPVLRVESLEESLYQTLSRERFYSLLLGLFASLALALAGSGIYGVFAYWVSQRTREIGLRVALGATPSGIFRLIVTRGLVVAMPSLVVGSAMALAVSRTLSATFSGIEPFDPMALLLGAAVLVAVALTACLIPARQAASVAPTVALRSD